MCLNITEEHVICSRYNGPTAGLQCILFCSRDCSNIGARKRECDPAPNIDARYCCCIKNINVPYRKCVDRCKSKGYSFSYDEETLECKCVCSENICSSFCETANKLGKCQDLANQKPMKNPCNCYCDETCGLKFNSKYVEASCNENHQCIKTCNGTQEVAPPWCILNEDKCGCTCSKELCKTFCKPKNLYGICHNPTFCRCQPSAYTDEECYSCCNIRTRNPPKNIPSETGHCKCFYKADGVCSPKCSSTKVCSPIDGCFCEDNDESIAQLKIDANKCKEQLCYGQYNKSLMEKNVIVAAIQPNRFRGIICIGSILLTTRPYIIVDVPGVAFAEIKQNGEQATISNNCHFALQDEKYSSTLFSPIKIILKGHQDNFSFKKMKQKERIPRQAVRFDEGNTFGRAFGGQVIGTINRRGIMVGGNLTLPKWTPQQPIFPKEFEIFVCNS